MLMERHADPEELRAERAFAELLGKSPPRPLPPAEDEAVVRKAVHTEWRRVAAGQVRRRRIAIAAIAASVLLVIFTTLNLTRDPGPDIASLQFAAIEKQFGTVTINARVVRVDEATMISGGDRIDTGSGSGVALRWHDGGSLRIDEGTTLVVEGDDLVYLHEGRVYFDSQASPLASRATTAGPARIAIRTDHGVVRHMGTQYMARVDDDGLVVSVREGFVAIDGGKVPARAAAGQQFAISASGQLSIADTNGVDDWEWVELSTPAVALDGRTVAEALEWVSRESGRRISYASEDAAILANDSYLRGFYDVPPSRALELFMPTTALDASIEGEVIVISED